MSELQVGQKVWVWHSMITPFEFIIRDRRDGNIEGVRVADNQSMLVGYGCIYQTIQALNAAIEAHSKSEAERILALRVPLNGWFSTPGNMHDFLIDDEVAGFVCGKGVYCAYTGSSDITGEFNTIEEAKAAVEKALGIAEVKE